MKRDAQEDAWFISALSLDSLLSSYEDTAEGEGGRFFPLVKKPQGGDSLVLYFAFDDATLTPRSLQQLRLVAELMTANDHKLAITGHTDDVGGEQYNEELSARRAQAVKRALVGMEVPADSISTAAQGKKRPMRQYASTSSEKEIEHARAENRRAEIYLDFQ